MEENQDISKYEKKQLKKQEKEEQRRQVDESRKSSETKKKVKKYIIISIIVLLILIGGYYLIIKPINDFKLFYSVFYHWHANFEVSVCGKPVDVKCKGTMCGPMNLHHHNDNIIHMEGNSLAKKEDIAIGKFFEGIGVTFSETQLMGKNNGDLCDDKQGSVKLYINGKENYEFRNYVPKVCDAQAVSDIKQRCDNIELKFE